MNEQMKAEIEELMECHHEARLDLDQWAPRTVVHTLATRASEDIESGDDDMLNHAEHVLELLKHYSEEVR